jgi:hypothetical protein
LTQWNRCGTSDFRQYQVRADLARGRRVFCGIIIIMTQFKLVCAPDQEIFQQRLNDFIADLSENITIGHIKFDTTTMLNGDIMYSALITYGKTQEW